MKIEFKDLDIALNDKLDKFFQRKNLFIEVNPGNVILPRKISEIGEAIIDLPVREDDVWVVSFLRTGSTWTQEMVWLLGNKLDYGGARKLQLIRTPLLELSGLYAEAQMVSDYLTDSSGSSVTYVNNMPSPRFIKSHLPWKLLPAEMDSVKPKIIYIARNPKDLCVSFYHHCSSLYSLCGDFNDFCDLFLSDCGPMGAVWNHILTFWKKRNESNILFLKFEDLKRDLPAVVKKVATFLEFGRDLTEAEVVKLCDHLQFDRMQNNPAVNLEPILNFVAGTDLAKGLNLESKDSKFIRKGEIGDWKNYMSKATSEKFDEWYQKNFEGTGLEFDFE